MGDQKSSRPLCWPPFSKRGIKFGNFNIVFTANIHELGR